MKLKKEDLKKLKPCNIDPVGCVYEYDGTVLRVIEKEYKDAVCRIMDCGLIEELVKEELLVETGYSDHHIEDDDIILWHRKIGVKQHYSQWSFDMFKDAALLVLETNRICNKYGYELKDAHPLNVMFDGTKPCWVDFGSIDVKRGDKWCARGEFLLSFYYPLKLWSKGYEVTVKAMYQSPGYLDLYELTGLNIPFLRNKNRRYIRRMIDIYNDHFYSGMIKKLPGFTEPHLAGISSSRSSSEKEGKQKIETDETTDYITGLIADNKDISSVIELESARGMLSYHVSKKTETDRIIATNSDKFAVNEIYRFIRDENTGNVTPLVMDFINGSINELEKNRSDLCIAGEIIRQCLFTYGMPFDELMLRLCALTGKYLIMVFDTDEIMKEDKKGCRTLEKFLNGESGINRFFHVSKTKEVFGKTICFGMKRG